MARSLDRRLAADLSYLLDRDGPDELAHILIKVSERYGFRGALEEAIWQHVRARHPGRRVELMVTEGGSR
jgi:hypothetical protein